MSIFFSHLWEMLTLSGAWLVVSFTVCGLLRGILRAESFQRSLGNKKFSSIVKSTVSGMLLPICSCGVTPLTIGLYKSGAFLGPTLAFLVAAPIINPAAIILSYALLGPLISTIYLISGFILPVIIGLVANRFGGNLVEPPVVPIQGIVLAEEKRPSFAQRLLNGLKWGYGDLAVQACRFIVMGLAFAALLLTVMPMAFIQSYLASPALFSIIVVAFLGALMYVCAVGHIPFIAALVAVGTSPGMALTFLLVGVSTNLPEMISIWKLIGKRAVFIYTGIVVVYGIIVGYTVNLLFAQNFVPNFDLSAAPRAIQVAGYLNLQFPEAFKIASGVIIATAGVYSWLMYSRRFLRR